MNSLAQKLKSSGVLAATLPEESRPSYPSLSLSGEQAKALGLTECTVGDRYKIEVEVLVTRVGDYNAPRPGETPAVNVELHNGAMIEAIEAEEKAEGEEYEKPEAKSEDNGEDKEEKAEDSEEETPKQKTRTLSPKDAGMMDEED